MLEISIGGLAEFNKFIEIEIQGINLDFSQKLQIRTARLSFLYTIILMFFALVQLLVSIVAFFESKRLSTKKKDKEESFYKSKDI